MPSRSQLKIIANSRLKTVRILIKAKDWQMAAYMMAMTLEIALKALICKKLNLTKYPDHHRDNTVQHFFKTHNLRNLALLAGLNQELTNTNQLSKKWKKFISIFPTKNWPDIRYMPANKWSETEIQAMMSALSVILTKIKKLW